MTASALLCILPTMDVSTGAVEERVLEADDDRLELSVQDYWLPVFYQAPISAPEWRSVWAINRVSVFRTVSNSRMERGPPRI